MVVSGADLPIFGGLSRCGHRTGPVAGRFAAAVGGRGSSLKQAGLPAAPRDIPIGTAYAVWTGIGATGTFIVGILFHGDPASAGRLVSVGLIVAGIVGLKLAHGAG
ncbi:MAG: hypothetical protein H6972_08400 [Gammaproteobacteria bacterium]|nr:hypothetical protein [Gammaproteobacteria bacterium]